MSFDGWSVGVVGSTVVFIGGNALWHWWCKVQRPFTKTFGKDVIYVYQFPRMPVIPSLSPRCLALETWLRFAKVPYQNVVGPAWNRSREDVLPFVEINGVEYSGAKNIISYLSALHQETNPQISASNMQVKKVEQMVDDLTWCYYYFRYTKNANDLFSKEIIGKSSVLHPLMPGCSVVYNSLILNNDMAYRNGDTEMLAKLISDRMKEKLKEKGFADLGETEVTERAKGHLSNIENNMGVYGNFLLGNNVSVMDCFLFGTLAQILYVPCKSPLKSILKQEHKILVGHCERMKRFWPDWEKILETGNMNTHVNGVDVD